MRRNVILAAALAIAVALAGCSKGEDGTENSNNMNTDAKAISADIRKHIVGKWVHDGSFEKGFPFAEGNTATATFPYTNERSCQKDTLQFLSDGKLLITLEGESETYEALYNVPEPDISSGLYVAARIEVILPVVDGYGKYLPFRDVRAALFEPGYNTLCLHESVDYWRYRRIE